MSKTIKVSPQVETLPTLYIHKCMICDLLFNDTEKPALLPFANYTNVVLEAYGKQIHAASLCKRCNIHFINFRTEKMKTISDPFQDDKLAIGGEVLKKEVKK